MENFKIVNTRPLPTMHGEAVQLSHPASGARILHIKCPDAENCFCIAVPTPPPDDTGMPHILEHMTLAGSEKFQCKEPFFEMIKRSVATFINALTGNDITYYPVCSTVKADLFNLANVYFDAVFHPILSESTFAREAYHLAPADPADPTGTLRYDGIVYSEMKGVFSSPEGILERDSVRKLLPDTCHGKESGGNPEDIPSLTLDALRQFHATRYNPSNAFIILFGDIPTEEWLEFLEPRLAGFRPQPAPPPVRRQRRWDAPREISTTYPLPRDEDDADKTYLMMNWLVGDTLDLAFSSRLAILSYLLAGNDGSPLTKAIDDSHAGANVIMASAIPNGAEYSWHIAIDGSKPESMPLFRKTIFDTLEALAAKPFPKGEIEAAFQQTVYSCNEIGSQYAFNTTMGAATTWCLGLDPASLLEKAPYFEQARRDIEADPMLLPRMIRECFLDNPHRLEITMAPSHDMSERQDAELTAKLAGIRASLDDSQVGEIAAKAEALEKANARPNSPEDLACLPKLSKADMPPVPPECATRTLKFSRGGEMVATTEMLTNGIVYLTLSFDIRGLPARLTPFIDSFVEAVDDFGTKGLDYVETAKKRSRCTGSFSAKYIGRVKYGDEGTFLPAIELSVKTTLSSLDDALAVMKDAIFGMDPYDPQRMSDVLQQQLTILRSFVVSEARATTARHAARTLYEAAAQDCLVNGLPRLRLAERLCAADKDSAYREAAGQIAEIRDWLLATHKLTASLVAPPEITDKIASVIDSWLGEMSGIGGAAIEAAPPFVPDLAPRDEGLSAALQVSFSALFTPAPRLHMPMAIPLTVGASLVSSDYMLPEIRFKGNAYGAGLTYDAHSGFLRFSSFRDPHIAETRETMLKAAQFARGAVWSQETIDNAILTVLKGYVSPFRPAGTCGLILSNLLRGYTEDARRHIYRNILALKAGEVQDATVAALEEGLPHAAYCVAASDSALREASAAIPNLDIKPMIGPSL